MTILLTLGEPAGIGPDVTILAAQQKWQQPLVAIADPSLLTDRASQLDLPLNLTEIDQPFNLPSQAAGYLYCLRVPLKQPCVSGKLDVRNAAYVIETLELASSLCLNNNAKAVATGPVHKGILNEAGVTFTGHTEFFAKMAKVKQTVMLFVIETVKVALATTHLPLSSVPKAITQESLSSILDVLLDGLKAQFKIDKPRLLVCGLNPHAGEEGHLGREEIEVIAPVIHQFAAKGAAITGPYPADTVFTPYLLTSADVILAMYHDQALPVVKYMGFDKAVNVTLGLPFIRTSVDHGTALNKAGTRKANAGSMIAAIQLASDLIFLGQDGHR